MAKWKNALLISTIVAPIAFGASPLGDAFASKKSEVPKSTDVTIHKYVKSEASSETGSDYIYWGNGTNTDTNNPFTSDPTWLQGTAADGYVFTAYNLPKTVNVDKSGTPTEVKLITFTDNDEPVIAHALIDEDAAEDSALDGLYWDDVLKAEPMPMDGVASAAGNTTSSKVNQYTISILNSYQTESFYTALQGALTVADSDTTANGGTATFDNLPNGNYIIFETDTTAHPEVKDKSVPMVVSLPMMNPTATSDTDEKYWFDNGGTNNVHLYPKNYVTSADLLVKKVDGTTGADVIGATFAIFQATADEQKDITELLESKIDGEPYMEVTALDDIKAAIKGILGDASEATYDDLTTDGTVANDTFTGLKPGATYYVVELDAPGEYNAKGNLQQVVFGNADTTTGDKTVTVSDPDVDYTGGSYTFTNMDGTIDKTVTINGETTGQGAYAEGTDSVGDKDQGVNRGQDFTWGIKSNLSTDYTDFDKAYTITDTLPYQANWYSMDIAIGGIADLLQVKHNNPQGETTGGLTGHAVSFDNQSDADADYDDHGDENFAALMTDWTNSDGVTLTGNFSKLPTAIAEEFEINDQAEFDQWLNDNIQISGYSSNYEFQEKNRVAVPVGDDDGAGKLVIDFKNEPARQMLAALAAATTSANRNVNITLHAQANSGAQADVFLNDAELKLENTYTDSKDSDKVQTFDAGWEIVKTNQSGEKLADAGFDLAVGITSANKDGLLQNFYNGKVKDSDSVVVYDRTSEAAKHPEWINMFVEAALSSQFTQDKYSDYDTYAIAKSADMTPDEKKQALTNLAYASNFATDAEIDAEALENLPEGDTPTLHDLLVSMMNPDDYEVDGQGVLFFMHKDATTGAAMADMNMGATGVIMGDVIWTPVAAWATTHITGDDGYIQYCGLAAGTYALIESQTPKGYEPLTSTATIGSETFPHAEKFELGMPGSTVQDSLKTGTNQPSGEIDGKPDVQQDVNVVNSQKSIFPLVGGLGTLFAVIAGLLAMGLALLKRKKDMKNEA
ncbi:SpaA isopeptide-forming pilin-related protein [Weissella confusa]|uniref:SpaA isopeptide-forming pilin-related protein n=1 Tax=Weissella confusa TaxID=1583 RepID=UPI0018F10DA5|nr:SpaA isopeptide-forming pilin-related protein [Weissella confusa]MBJ7660734.1 hypothetical protein [Weissella confusa]